MSVNEHDDDQPDSFEVIERLRAQLASKDAEVAKRTEHIQKAAEAHSTLTAFAIVVSVMESGALYGGDDTAATIIRLAKAEQQRQLRIYDHHVKAAKRL